MTDLPLLKPVIWVGSSLKDLRTFPEPVQDHLGYAFYVAQRGGRHRDTKTLSRVWRGHADAVYVLHAFQKKSKAGRATHRRDIELIEQRMREAEQIARERGHE